MSPKQEKEHCRNCGTELAGAFCHECGQSVSVIRRPTLEILKEVRSHILHWDARFLQTLKLLMFRPASLSLDWIDGKRARHVPPFRLYIVASFVLFLMVGIATDDLTMQAESIDVSSSAFEFLQEELEEAEANGEWLSSIILKATISGLEDPVGYLRTILSNLPKAAFLLLPLFAILHKLVDARQKRYYIDYLIFSLHFHAFAFLVIALGILMGFIYSRLEVFAEFMNLVIPVYGVIGFKKFNRQGWLKSILKAFIAFGAYSVILAIFVGFYFAAMLLV